MAADDHRLMMGFRSGDTAAFDALYARHKGPLYRYFARLAPAEAADDLFQETWIRIVDAAHRYRPSAPFTAYLFRIAHNVLMDHYRKTRRAPDRNDAEGELPDPGPSPAALHEQAELRARITAALRGLPEDQREAFLLQQEGGLTLAQIGEVVGCSRETVKSRLRYACAKLRRALGDDAAPMERSA